MKAQELSPIAFTYQKYEVNPFDRLDIPYDWGSRDGMCKTFINRILDRIVGWCDSEKLTIRPREGIAVMCEDDCFEQFWFHVTDALFKDSIEPKLKGDDDER